MHLGIEFKMFFKKIFLAGHNGMVGSSIYRALKKRNLSENIIIANKDDLDLRNQMLLEDYLVKLQH